MTRGRALRPARHRRRSRPRAGRCRRRRPCFPRRRTTRCPGHDPRHAPTGRFRRRRTGNRSRGRRPRDAESRTSRPDGLPRIRLTTPKQFGPMSLIPWWRAIRASSRCAATPDAPASAKPAVRMTQTRADLSPRRSTTAGSSAAGTATTARSTPSGSSSTSDTTSTPGTSTGRRATASSRPVYPPARMFSVTSRPTPPRCRLIPMTATESGSQSGRREAASDCRSRQSARSW